MRSRAMRQTIRVPFDEVPTELGELISERDFQQTVLDVAVLMGWEPYHTHDSRRSQPGFPDLVLVRPPRVIFAELKTTKGKLTARQRAWGQLLEACSGIEYRIWRPSYWSEIIETLERGKNAEIRSRV